MARRQVDRMSQTVWHPTRQIGVVSYRGELLLPMNQLDSVVQLWK